MVSCLVVEPFHSDTELAFVKERQSIRRYALGNFRYLKMHLQVGDDFTIAEKTNTLLHGLLRALPALSSYAHGASQFGILLSASSFRQRLLATHFRPSRA